MPPHQAYTSFVHLYLEIYYLDINCTYILPSTIANICCVYISFYAFLLWCRWNTFRSRFHVHFIALLLCVFGRREWKGWWPHFSQSVSVRLKQFFFATFSCPFFAMITLCNTRGPRNCVVSRIYICHCLANVHGT